MACEESTNYILSYSIFVFNESDVEYELFSKLLRNLSQNSLTLYLLAKQDYRVIFFYCFSIKLGRKIEMYT